MRVRKALEEEAPPRCSFCGRELPLGEFYWYISGWFLCPDCLPDFARAEYQRFRLLRPFEGSEIKRMAFTACPIAPWLVPFALHSISFPFVLFVRPVH